MSPSVASLAMYPFAHVRVAQEALWSAIRERLGDGPESLEWSVLTPDVWSHPDLLLAQCCGWPAATSFADRLSVIGCFASDVAGAEPNGTYHSMIVTGDPTATLAELRVRPDLIAAVNSFDSLSGRVSLQHVLGGALPASVIDTGAHMESVRRLAARTVDIAAIDGVTWVLIGEQAPELVASLRVIGSGPRIPCLPLVTRDVLQDRVPALRDAIAGAVADPALVDALRALHIRGFVPRDLSDYLPVRALVP